MGLLMKTEEKQLTVAFRIPETVKRHYESLAAKERRNLSQVLRLVLEDHAKGLCGNGRKKAA
jgi:hypothetical protein